MAQNIDCGFILGGETAWPPISRLPGLGAGHFISVKGSASIQDDQDDAINNPSLIGAFSFFGLELTFREITNSLLIYMKMLATVPGG